MEEEINMRDMTEDMKDHLAVIFDFYGMDKQAMQLCEECGELI